MKTFALFACLVLAACTAHRTTEPPSDDHAAAQVWPIEVIPLQFASATEVAHTLDQTALSEPRTRAIADPRTNSLVIQGPDDGRAAARALIAKLDVERPAKP